MEYQDKYDLLVKMVTEDVEIEGKKYNLKDDFEKFFVKSNKSAGTRIRKVMQEVKNFLKKSEKMFKIIKEKFNLYELKRN